MQSLRLAALATSLAAAVVATPRAQAELRVTEVGFDGDGWVEVANLGDAPGSLDGWSLYHADAGPNTVGAAWWAFPPGLALAPGARILVHWAEEVPVGGSAPGEFWTGEAPSDFLFSIRGIPFEPAAGALGLLSDQAASAMGLASTFEDWMCWGRSDLRRHGLAVQAGLWTTGDHAATALRLPRPSLALDELAGRVRPRLGRHWFRDESPTPGTANHPGLGSVLQSGTGCEHLVRAPRTTLDAASVPASGNLDFAIRLDHDVALPRGPWAGTLFLGTARADLGLPQPLPPSCRLLVDGFVSIPWMPQEGALRQDIRLRIPAGFAGLEVYMQAVVVHATPWTGDLALTNRLELTIGS